MTSARSDVLTLRALTVALRARSDPRMTVDDVVAAADGHAPALARALARVRDPRIENDGPSADRAATLLRRALDLVEKHPAP